MFGARWHHACGLAALLGASACGKSKHSLEEAARAAPQTLAVGQDAPDFVAHDQDGKAVQLAALRGKSVVLYFYPKDETTGCTREASAFRDGWTALRQRNAVVIGVSTDSDASHRAFAANHQLPFSLLSDPGGALAAKYGVPLMLGLERRQSFVIGPDGKLKKIYRTVDVAVHAREIAADVQ
jgi:thioredoxin-dependent peroxiredoxin